MKSPPARGVKEVLKPLAYGRPEGYARLVRGGLMACLLKYEPASSSARWARPPQAGRRSESESEEGAPAGAGDRAEETRNRVSYPWPA